MKATLLAFASVVLVACGGGGGDPAATSVPLADINKQIAASQPTPEMVANANKKSPEMLVICGDTIGCGQQTGSISGNWGTGAIWYGPRAPGGASGSWADGPN